MKILVAVASTYGSTREIGERVAQVLSDAGHEVDVESVERVATLAPYDACVLGSAVYIGRILTQARKFAVRLAQEFPPRPVFVFASGMKNVTNDPLAGPFVRPVEPPYLAGRFPTFGGYVDRTQLGPSERALVGFVGAAQQDERDFDLIEAWAGEVVEYLETTPSAE